MNVRRTILAGMLLAGCLAEAQSTRELKRFTLPSAWAGPSQAVVGSRLVLWADDGNHGTEPWSTDGTADGTELLGDLAPGDAGSRIRFDGVSTVGFVRLGDTALFNVQSEGTDQVWRTDGTPTGTFELSEPGDGGVRRVSNEAIAFDGTDYFYGEDDVNGAELWRSDGTPMGTTLVEDIDPGSPSSHWFGEMADVGARFIFSARDGFHGAELWSSDGTRAGTTLLKDLVPGDAGSNPEGFFAFGDAYYFDANDDAGMELWRTDGTSEGTHRVVDVDPGPATSYPNRFAVLGGKLLFFADDGVHGREPWITDGSAAGTSILKDIHPGPEGSGSPTYPKVAVIGNVALFFANDGVHGMELFRTDGTPDGTELVKDLRPGDAGSTPDFAQNGFVIQNPTAIGKVAVFQADDGVHGTQFWISDGTADGTLAYDTGSLSVPTPCVSSFPHLGNEVFASTCDWDAGSWSLVAFDLDTSPPVIRPHVSGVLDGGWYRSDVSITYDVSDPDSRVVSNTCIAQEITTDTAGTTIRCTARSYGGASTSTVQIRRDTSPPAPSTPPAPHVAGGCASAPATANGLELLALLGLLVPIRRRERR